MPHWLDFLLHSLHWGDVPAYLGAFISLVFGVLSYRSSRRSKAAELEAKKHAQDALAAQQQTAEETKKLAAATERQTQLAELETQAAEHAAEQAPWRIEKRPSGAAAVIDAPGHYLVNVTPRPKYDVSVEGSLLPDAAASRGTPARVPTNNQVAHRK